MPQYIDPRTLNPQLPGQQQGGMQLNPSYTGPWNPDGTPVYSSGYLEQPLGASVPLPPQTPALGGSDPIATTGYNGQQIFQPGIPSSAYTRPNPLAGGYDDLGRTPGQMYTYNNGSRVPFNPNVPNVQTTNPNPLWTPEVWNSFAVPAAAMTLGASLGGGGDFGAGGGVGGGAEQLSGPGFEGGTAGGVGGGVGAGAGAGTAGAGGATPTLGQVGSAVSGGSALVNALGGGQSGGGAAGGSNTGGIIGSLLGGALGGLQGGNRPAGTTTTTTNQTLAPGGLQNLQDTIAGRYLDPASNPYLSQTYDAAARQITPRINSLFEASGRYGSGAQQGVLGQNLSDLATNIYGGNYNAERARQFGAAGTSIGNTVQNPYFTNPLAGILSGATAGGILGGNLFGSGGGVLSGIGNLFGGGSSGSSGSGGYPDQLSGPGSGYTPPSYGSSPVNYGGSDPGYYGASPTPASIDQSYVRRIPLGDSGSGY